MLKIGVVGGTGKLGKEVIEYILTVGSATAELGAVITRPGNPYVGSDLGKIVIDDLLKSANQCDVYLDCTHAQALGSNLEAYGLLAKPVVIATTGFDSQLESRLKELANETPVLLCENLSREVYQFLQIVNYACQVLDGASDVEIIEIHGKEKKDMPSGTARKIARILQQSRRQAHSEDIAISTHSLRMGDTVGEHKVLFVGHDNAQVELTHRQFSRRGYAEGMLEAAGWIIRQSNGLYGIDDLFGDEIG